MKKLLVIVVALAAVNAQATRARVTALSNSPHLVDTQTVYTNPADIFSLGGDYVTLETGNTASTNATDGAEGMIVRSMGDAKMGLSLGHDSNNASNYGLRTNPLSAFGGNALPAGFQRNQDNPIEFTYGAKAGDMAWAGTFVYSTFNDKTTTAGIKENSMGLRLGARTGQWDASLRLGLVNTVEVSGTGKYTGTLGLGASGGYQMDSLYVFGGLTQAGYKAENAAGTETHKFTTQSLNVGAMSSMKKDGSEWFYGAQLVQTDAKETVSDAKQTTLSVPVWIGVEADAASWLVLRGSVRQTLQLINNLKREAAAATVTDQAPAGNDTVVSAGAGLKFNKVIVDGTLQGSTTQQFNGTNMLAMLGMTYMF